MAGLLALEKLDGHFRELLCMLEAMSLRSNKHSNTYRPVSGWSHSADFTAFTVQIRANIIPVMSTLTSGDCLLAIGLVGIHAFKPHFNLHHNTIVQVSSDIWRISPGGSDSALQGSVMGAGSAFMTICLCNIDPCCDIFQNIFTHDRLNLWPQCRYCYNFCCL